MRNLTVLSVGETEIAPKPLHLLLREATREVHKRLHRHDGFAAIQNSTINIAEYRRLLLRLYGFYVPLEPAAAIGHDRSVWLEDDLSALDVDRQMIAAAPRCSNIPGLNSAEGQLGARYVIEGPALGGRELGRCLDGLLGPGVARGRWFFLGNGSGTGEAWKGYLAHLSAASDEPEVRAAITKAAIETFKAFEEWLSGWSSVTHV